MNNSLISKYIPLDTIVHRLDPRTKLFFTTIYLINVFIAQTVIEFGVLILFLVLAAVFSKTNINILINSIKPVVLLIFFTSLVHLVFNKRGDVLIEFYGFNLYSGAVIGILLISIRFLLVVMMMVIFMASTSPNEITNAIEKSFGFLSEIGLPVSTFSLVLSISLRFIPTILEETNRIINAQVSRGSDFNEGSLSLKVRKFIPILIPLFIATLKRADELATAMEVRGYSVNIKRSRYKKLEYKKLDYLSYLLIIGVTIYIAIIK